MEKNQVIYYHSASHQNNAEERMEKMEKLYEKKRGATVLEVSSPHWLDNDLCLCFCADLRTFLPRRVLSFYELCLFTPLNPHFPSKVYQPMYRQSPLESVYGKWE